VWEENIVFSQAKTASQINHMALREFFFENARRYPAWQRRPFSPREAKATENCDNYKAYKRTNWDHPRPSSDTVFRFLLNQRKFSLTMQHKVPCLKLQFQLSKKCTIILAF